MVKQVLIIFVFSNAFYFSNGQNFIWPFEGNKTVTQSFGTCVEVSDPNEQFYQHSGIDIKKPANTIIHSPLNDKIVKVNHILGTSSLEIVIAHYDDNLFDYAFTFLHCDQLQLPMLPQLYTGSWVNGITILVDPDNSNTYIELTENQPFAVVADIANANTTFAHLHLGYFEVPQANWFMDPLEELENHDPGNHEPVIGPLFLRKQEAAFGDFFDYSYENACFRKVNIVKKVYDHMDGELENNWPSFPPTSEKPWNSINDRFNGITGSPKEIEYWIENSSGTKVFPIANEFGKIAFTGQNKNNEDMLNIID